jgi:hypothetical protein
MPHFVISQANYLIAASSRGQVLTAEPRHEQLGMCLVSEALHHECQGRRA